MHPSIIKARDDLATTLRACGLRDEAEALAGVATGLSIICVARDVTRDLATHHAAIQHCLVAARTSGHPGAVTELHVMLGRADSARSAGVALTHALANLVDGA